MTIGDRFSEIRKTLRFNQSELARSIDANPSIISDIERGEKEPSKKIIASLIIKYRINSNWLLTGEGDMYIKNDQPQKSRLEQEFEEAVAAHPKFSEMESRLAAIETLLKEKESAPKPETSNDDASEVPVSEESPQYTVENEAEYCEEAEEECEQVLYVHDIAAGPPIDQSEDYSEMVAAPVRLMKKSGKYYAASIRGTSMTETGIRDGDMVLIRHTDVPNNGVIQVVRYEDKSTLKRLRELKGNRWELHYEDGTGRVITCGSGDYEVQGEFVAVLPENAVRPPSKKPPKRARGR